MIQTPRDFYNSAREILSTYFEGYQLAYAGAGYESRDSRSDDFVLDNVVFFGDQMKRRQLIRLIQDHGGKLVRSSSHQIWEVDGRTAPVPHGCGGKEIPGGTVKSILRMLGINIQNDF